jgi:hypothetical protein
LARYAGITAVSLAMAISKAGFDDTTVNQAIAIGFPSMGGAALLTAQRAVFVTTKAIDRARNNLRNAGLTAQANGLDLKLGMGVLLARPVAMAMAYGGWSPENVVDALSAAFPGLSPAELVDALASAYGLTPFNP